MDKIKTLKIKNEDGTVSQESYYISADARNIDMSNGKNVQETIGTIDIDNNGSIAEQLISIKQNTLEVDDIVDNLTSNETNKALSAKQGKELKTLIDNNASEVITTYATKNELDIEKNSRIADDTILNTNLTNEINTRTTAITNEIAARQSGDVALQNQINGLASGSPLVASSTSGMTDTSRVYINTTDGHWYYYNGSTWSDGGIYQAVANDDLADDIEAVTYDSFSVENDWAQTLVITKGASWNFNTGAGVSNAARARIEYRQSTARTKMVILSDSTYLMKPAFHSNSRDSWTADYLGTSHTWGSKFYLGDYPYFVLSFKRTDEATWTDADTEALRAALHFYQLTDTSLTLSNAPADAKITGDKIIELDKQNYFISDFSLSASDFKEGGYWGSNTGSWVTDTSNRYIGTTNKIWDSDIYAIGMINSDYKIRILYYDNSNTYKTYSGDYADGYIYLPNRSEYQGIHINAKRSDSEAMTSEDITNIATGLVFYKMTNLVHTNITGLKDSGENYIIQTNPVVIVNPEIYTSYSSYTISGITYSTRMWKDGYLDGSGTGITQSGFYVSTFHALDAVTGSVPAAVKIKIKDTSVLSYPYIRLGWYNSPSNIIIALIRGESEVTIPVPTYPDYPDTTAGLVCTVGRFATTAQTKAEWEERANTWAEENIEISLIFKPLYNQRNKTQALKGSTATNGFLYNSDLEYALKVPISYQPFAEKKTPLVILCHGYSSTITPSVWGSSGDMIKLVNIFVNAGYAVMDVQRVTTADWCNPALVRKYRTAIDHILEHYNVEVKYMFGESMGCLIALALQQYYNIRAIALSGLRLSFEERYSSMAAEPKAIVDANLGLTNGWDKNIIAMYDATVCELIDEYGERINYKTFPPILGIQGTEDTTNFVESQEKVHAIQRGGSIAKLSLYPGNHHAVCYLLADGSATEVLNWFEMHK